MNVPSRGNVDVFRFEKVAPSATIAPPLLYVTRSDKTHHRGKNTFCIQDSGNIAILM